jgi:hypothetical protein
MTRQRLLGACPAAAQVRHAAHAPEPLDGRYPLEIQLFNSAVSTLDLAAASGVELTIA